MGSLDIFVENINRLAAHYHLDTYADIAQFLNVTPLYNFLNKKYRTGTF